MYKESLKQKLRYNTNKGVLTTEQLFDLSLTDLNDLALDLEEQYKNSGRKSYLEKRTPKDKTLKLQADLVLDILNTKVEENDELKSQNDRKKHNEKILALIAEKEEENLKELSTDELKALLK